MILSCLETCSTACHASDAWIQGPVHLLFAAALFVLASMIHQGTKYVMPRIWLYACSVPVTASVAWEICSYSILGTWNWPRLLWPCGGILTLLLCLGIITYRIEKSFPGLTSSYFRGGDEE